MSRDSRTTAMRRSRAALLAIVGLLAACTDSAAHHSRQMHHHPAGPPARTSPTLTGTAGRPMAWQISHRDDHGIAGFANPISVLPGRPVRLYVSTSAPHFRVRAFRMGWYDGALAKLVWTSPTYPGRRQSGPALVAPATNTMAANWSPSLTVDTTGWAPGDYLLRLDGTGHRRQFVPLTVRDRSAAGRVVLVNAVTTWQAYNTWGCCDLYEGGDGSFATRSRAVSFDRPYQAEFGAGEFLRAGLPVVVEAERLGLRLDYVTDVDLQSVPHLLDGARAVISMGHDEYWSPAMRTAVTTAVHAGTNLASLGGNAIFRRIRLASTKLGPDRLEINYKIASEDPLNGVDNPAVTADWPAPPAADPESSLLGDQYGCLISPASEPATVVDPRNWMFHGAHVTAGQQLPGLIGPEIDAVQLGYPTPRPIEVLMHSRAGCPNNTPSYADASYYVASSGGAIFDAGTIRWSCAVRGNCHGLVSNITGHVVRTVTDNLLRAFAKGPAGRTYPAHDNLTALGIGGQG